MRTRHAALAAVTAGAILAAPLAAGLQPAAAVGTDSDPFPCAGFGMQDRANPISDLDRDLYTWGPYKRTKVGNGRHDINWKLDPHKQDSWKTLFHGLKWTGAYVYRSTEGPTRLRDPKAIDGAVAIAQDWVKDNRYPWPTGPGAGNATHDRADFLICLRMGLTQIGKPVPSWLNTTLVQHAEWLKKNTWADHNVGTDQTLAILGIGCTVGRRDLRDYAASKLAKDITRVIDSQGANNEQAVGYARWNHDLWGEVETAMTRCGINTPASRTIKARRAALQTFLEYALKPDGTYHQLGDTQLERPSASTMTEAQRWVVTDGKQGVAPKERVKIYNAGYVLGRSGWGNQWRPQSHESSYALRFGPVRTGHGHSDHTAITWHTIGRPILVDTGTGSYNQDAWRAHYIGPEAHNQLVMTGMRNGSATKLVRSKLTPKADFYQFSDTPYLKTSRVRSIVVMSDPEIVVAFDKATSYKPTTFTQLWHLPYDVSFKASGTRATAAGKGVTTTLLQLPAAGVTATKFGAVKGSTKPIQGWQWTDYFHKYKAPVATVTQKGTKAAMVTAIVAAPGTTPVSVKPVISGSTTTYTFRVGSKTAVVTLDAKGTLTRIR